ncbi:hypothetical protein AA2016_6247 (plasmid) [Aminobacter aminovorans]|uniref:Uncharacterized protein n=2 Tax=Aminobacter aminovorans TaxID=83263 RepID=A0AAC9ATK4_AMIAI|nr:hypothetical protein AA2016_6247 [Aminobacter aminovorans]
MPHGSYPMRMLDAWPSDDRRTRLVFVPDGVESEPVRRLFDVALDNRTSRIRRVIAELAMGIGSFFGSATTTGRA